MFSGPWLYIDLPTQDLYIKTSKSFLANPFLGPLLCSVLGEEVKYAFPDSANIKVSAEFPA